ncbi:ABC transporter ATP-binding protein [Salipiger abyssi]|uniref:ABC transporter ATP-binding protein n=1 Tax=Salipiger abyssi TaxID=1250539 RepID=UPI001A8D1F7C|nr:ABC transporter ATP-binding protein [Salipiger abyssi]MBN9887214.1 ABC transporter ATP-binding protein [Salipiger abyssi]
MTGDTLLRVSDLKVSFQTEAGSAKVLDGVNLTIGRGEILGLVGESGCGKSTLARSVLGILPKNAARITDGTILFDGENLLERNEAYLARVLRGRRISFVPQDPFSSFSPVFSIGDQFMELMKWKSPEITDAQAAARTILSSRYGRARRRRDAERVMEMLSAVQLPQPEAILRKYPHEVSGGQRQRLMIAMALLTEPELIIADEPTTALDVTIQAQILKLLKALAAERNVAVLFTTHDLGTAWEICDRIMVMYAGQDVEVAGSADFFARPNHPYTDRLLASLPGAEGGLQGIPGNIPGFVSPPGGCRFHPRCDLASDACRTTRPGVTALGSGHAVRCHHPLGTQFLKEAVT